MSHKSPIHLKCSSILFLKVFYESHSTTDGGKLFYVVTVLCEKLFLLTSSLAFGVSHIKECPRWWDFSNWRLWNKYSIGRSSSPLKMLKTSIKSPRILLVLSVVRLRRLSLSSHGTFSKPVTIFVARLWFFSKVFAIIQDNAQGFIHMFSRETALWRTEENSFVETVSIRMLTNHIFISYIESQTVIKIELLQGPFSRNYYDDLNWEPANTYM